MTKKEIEAQEAIKEALKTLAYYKDAKSQVSYVDDKESFSVPLYLNDYRIESLLSDGSVHEIRIIIKP